MLNATLYNRRHACVLQSSRSGSAPRFCTHKRACGWQGTCTVSRSSLAHNSALLLSLDPGVCGIGNMGSCALLHVASINLDKLQDLGRLPMPLSTTLCPVKDLPVHITPVYALQGGQGSTTGMSTVSKPRARMAHAPVRIEMIVY